MISFNRQASIPLLTLASLSVLSLHDSIITPVFSFHLVTYNSIKHRTIAVATHSPLKKNDPKNLPFRESFLQTSSQDETFPQSSKKEKELNDTAIAEMIEVSFVNACMQLATGYVDVLKLFIVSVKAAYKKGLSMADISDEVQRCPVQSANRPLMAEEINLRQTWMDLVYLSLQYLNHPSGIATEENVGDTVDRKQREKFQDFIENVVNAKRNGQDLANLKLKDVLGKMNIENKNDPMEVAILSHSLRLVYLTMTVLEEEARCEDEAPSPKPPIPGAF